MQCYAEPNDVFLEPPPTSRAVFRVNVFSRNFSERTIVENHGNCNIW